MILKIASLRVFILFLVLFLLIEFFFNINMSNFTEQTGGHKLLDMSVGYSADFAYEQLVTYNDARKAYFSIRTADSIFPVVYAFMFSILSVFIYKKKYRDKDNYRWVLCVPFAGALFDYIENTILIILFRLLPLQSHPAAVILNIVTILKFSLIALTLLLIITGALSLLKGGDSGLIMGNKFKGKK